MGIDFAMVVAGHSKLDTTEIYSKLNVKKAGEAAKASG